MTLTFPTEETIAAIATAISPEQGGIAIIRVSGSSAQKVCKDIVDIPGNQIWGSHRVLYGHVMDRHRDKQLDEILLLIMEGPRSYTGEDIVEIHCHGGLIAVQNVLERILENPNVRKAFPGEFSQRAVLNGRLSLTQAESINELVGARSNKAAEIAMSGINNEITQRVTDLRERLLDQLSELEARVDFEDDLPVLDEDKLIKELCDIQIELKHLVNDAKKGAYLRKGLRLALIGRPNVGKSSLLNRLCKYEKAIVTNVPGTTRDLVESEIVLKGVPVTLIDTAGIRTSDNEVEQIGIQRSHQAIMKADVIALVFDISQGWTVEDQKIFNQLPEETPRCLISNKVDLQTINSDFYKDKIPLPNEKNISTSAFTGQGEEALVNCILGICGANAIQDLDIALNERQQELAREAEKAILRTLDVSKQKLPWDFWTIDLKEAIQKLGELTGQEVTEAIFDRIFSRFCIGK